MSFLTEEEDNVNTHIAETLAQMRAEIDARRMGQVPYKGVEMHIGEQPYWPKHPSASNHPVDDYKSRDQFDYPKD